MTINLPKAGCIINPNYIEPPPIDQMTERGPSRPDVYELIMQSDVMGCMLIVLSCLEQRQINKQNRSSCNFLFSHGAVFRPGSRG